MGPLGSYSRTLHKGKLLREVQPWFFCRSFWRKSKGIPLAFSGKVPLLPQCEQSLFISFLSGHDTYISQEKAVLAGCFLHTYFRTLHPFSIKPRNEVKNNIMEEQEAIREEMLTKKQVLFVQFMLWRVSWYPYFPALSYTSTSEPFNIPESLERYKYPFRASLPVMAIIGRTPLSECG